MQIAPIKFLTGIVFRKQIKAEQDRDRIAELLGQRGDAISCLYRNRHDPVALAAKLEAEAELKKLGVF